jgi:ribonuclease J
VVTRGGKIPADDVYIDGNDLDGLSSAVIHDREILKNDGMVAVLVTINSKTNMLVVPPIVYARGFAAGRRHPRHPARPDARRRSHPRIMQEKVTFGEIKTTIKNAMIIPVSKYIYRKTERNPMIVPVIMNEGLTHRRYREALLPLTEDRLVDLIRIFLDHQGEAV